MREQYNFKLASFLHVLRNLAGLEDYFSVSLFTTRLDHCQPISKARSKGCRSMFMSSAVTRKLHVGNAAFPVDVHVLSFPAD